jgi:hypothetical protein
MQANYGKRLLESAQFIPRLGEFCRNSLIQDIPLALWAKAQAHAFNFRGDDLARTHWRKICRSLQDD